MKFFEVLLALTYILRTKLPAAAGRSFLIELIIIYTGILVLKALVNRKERNNEI
jgi:hypothetical protein